MYYNTKAALIFCAAYATCDSTIAMHLPSNIIDDTCYITNTHLIIQPLSIDNVTHSQPLVNTNDTTNVATLVTMAAQFKDGSSIAMHDVQRMMIQLNTGQSNSHQISMLSIQQVLQSFGIKSTGYLVDTPEQLLLEQTLTAFSIDNHHVFHLVLMQQNKHIYLLYGSNIICPIAKATFLKAYKNAPFLILK